MADADRCTPELLTAIRVLGLAWTQAEGLHPNNLCAAVSDALRLGDDGLWYATADEAATLAAFPDGLSLVEALGYTMAVAWVARFAHGEMEHTERWPIVAHRPLGRLPTWAIHLPSPCGEVVMLAAADALPICRALLTIRRAAFPGLPWGQRDMIAERLEHHARAMEAAIRGPAPVQVIEPEVIASDVGRDWSGGARPANEVPYGSGRVKL